MASQPYDEATATLNGWDTPQPRQAMSKEEIVSILRDQERASLSFRDTTIAGEQAAALDFYDAEPFGDEVQGRSQVVSKDVQEVVDYMQISVARTIVSGNRVVEFEPGDTDELPEEPEKPDVPQLPLPEQQTPEQQMQAQAAQQQMQQYQAARDALSKWEDRRKKAADDATEAVNYIFNRRQPGYRILIDWLQSGLIEKYGVIKAACVMERRKIKSIVTVQPDELAALYAQGADIVSQEQQQDGSIAVIIAQTQTVKRYRTFPVPSEEFIFPPRTKDEDDSRYLAHRCRKTLSDLVEMGFDRDVVESLPDDDGSEWNDVRSIARWDADDTSDYQRAPMMREVMLLEEYVKLDLDDDGVAELWQVFRVGDEILDMNEVDDQPFVVWTPFPRAHRLVGNSLADKTMDIQRIKSVLQRQTLDGLYLTIAPRYWLAEESINENTIDDLFGTAGKSGGFVRGKGTAPPTPMGAEGFDISRSLTMLEYMDSMRETRTGITRLNQGLDEDTINKTASGQAQLQATGQQIEEYVARNFAEALARLFAKLLRLMIAQGDPIAIKVDGNYRRVDPTTWDTNMDLAVNIGLGSGRKEQRLLYRQQLAEAQIEAQTSGLPIIDAKRIYNNLAAATRDAGLGNPDEYWLDPESEEAQQAQANQPQQPNPEMVKAQADAQKQQADTLLAQQKAQGEAEASQRKQNLAEQESAVKVQLQHQEGQNRIQLEAAKHEQTITLAAQKAEFEARLAQQTADRNYELALLAETHKHELAKQSADHGHAIAMERERQKVPQERSGGDLDK